MDSTEIQQFYARHMQLLDGGSAEAWARTFTPDATFTAPSMTEPVRGREGIAAGARAAIEDRAAAREVHRHWVNMTVTSETDEGADAADGTDSTEAVSYVQILATGRGAAPRVLLSCVMRDRLVSRDGELLVAQRRISRDDRPLS
ncbi:nuclear transport factor 2 family protein [Streptomyces rectiviolaceus]|uniref:SnoaL-like domain-containing protein n=1 Tax=Streptomyces rectiviolaceus TaxID=332591 RepID=A0ABP6MF63_9ACTN